MKLHFVGLPHTETVRDYEWCAYTSKLRHMGQICQSLEFDTVLYNGKRDEGRFGEVVEVVTAEDRDKWFGHIDWNTTVFGGWNPDDEWWQTMNQRAIEEINLRLGPTDIICIIAGRCQESVAMAFPNNVVLEWAVGYEGVLDSTHRCFESEAWRHMVYGKTGVNDGRFYDCVIPNSFDPGDFIYQDKKDDYLLYLGRLTPRKGMVIVEEIAKKHKVITAGQGEYRVPGAEHVGVVLKEEKAKLLAGAKALLVPTMYIEPFGGVAVEAMMSGTPVITTDFGAFTETVHTGISGERCRTLKDFFCAVDNIEEYNSNTVLNWGLRYSLNSVAPQWDRWYRQVSNLYEAGWYQ